MLRYMYIDESGDLGTQSKHLIITALIVSSPKQLDNIIRNIRRHSFKKQLRNAPEIKANKSSNNLRTHILRKLNELPDAQAFHIVLEKQKIRSSFLLENKHKLY